MFVSRDFSFGAALALGLLVGLRGFGAPAKDPVLALPDYQVQGNPVEDFGLRVSPLFDPVRRTYFPVVDLVLPNTAAAKGGIRPGDRIVAADGAPTGSGRSLSQWRALQQRKWKAMREAASGVSWTLAVEDLGSGEARTVTLRLPTPAPRWGGTVWQAPEGRPPARLTETGPLAERAQQILDHGIWMILRRSYAEGFGLVEPWVDPGILGYQWTLWDERGGHRMLVTRQRGRTDIVLEFIARPNHWISGGRTPSNSPDPTLASERTVLGSKAWSYLTSPAGELQAAIQLGRKEPLAPVDARPGFDREVDFWLHQVGRVSDRWPLERLPTQK